MQARVAPRNESLTMPVPRSSHPDACFVNAQSRHGAAAMKIERTKNPNRPTRVAVRSSVVPRADSALARDVNDVASIMGIPSHELTPKVTEALVSLIAEVDNLRQELARKDARIVQLEHLADQDTLVPVANRRAFVREMSRVMSFAERYGAESSLIFFDVNGLKQINDTFGHAAGDAALFRIATTLAENVRGSDVVGRLGGDEFGILLVQADEKAAISKASRLADEIAARPLEWNGATIPLRLAFGTFTFSGGENARDALEAADRAMYAQKHGNGAAAAS
jgi:diguanylate cyclase (GGDEF)-like protein